MKYTMKDFVKKKIAVRTGTGEKQKRFLEMCAKEMLFWHSGEKATDFTPNRYEEDTCIIFSNGNYGIENSLQYCGRGFYETDGWKIVDVDDFLPDEEAKKETQKGFIMKEVFSAKKWYESCGGKRFVPSLEKAIERFSWVSKCEGKTKAEIEKMGFGYSDNWFDYPDCPRIVITTDGKKTVAKMYSGEEVIKEAIARCAPCDTFDFEVGAKIAFERLTEDKKPEEKPVEKGFTGKALCDSERSLGYTYHKIYEFVDGKTIDDDGDKRPTNGILMTEEKLKRFGFIKIVE